MYRLHAGFALLLGLVIVSLSCNLCAQSAPIGDFLAANPSLEHTASASTPVISAAVAESCSLGRKDGMQHKRDLSILSGFGAGLVLSLPGTIILASVIPGHEPTVIPKGVDSAAYRTGYCQGSKSIRRGEVLVGGVCGSVVQLAIFAAILQESLSGVNYD